MWSLKTRRVKKASLLPPKEMMEESSLLSCTLPSPHPTFFCPGFGSSSSADDDVVASAEGEERCNLGLFPFP